MMPDATGTDVVARTIFAMRSRLSICPPGSQIVENPSSSSSDASRRYAPSAETFSATPIGPRPSLLILAPPATATAQPGATQEPGPDFKSGCPGTRHCSRLRQVASPRICGPPARPLSAGRQPDRCPWLVCGWPVTSRLLGTSSWGAWSGSSIPKLMMRRGWIRMIGPPVPAAESAGAGGAPPPVAAHVADLGAGAHIDPAYVDRPGTAVVAEPDRADLERAVRLHGRQPPQPLGRQVGQFGAGE